MSAKRQTIPSSASSRRSSRKPTRIAPSRAPRSMMKVSRSASIQLQRRTTATTAAMPASAAQSPQGLGAKSAAAIAPRMIPPPQR